MSLNGSEPDRSAQAPQGFHLRTLWALLARNRAIVVAAPIVLMALTFLFLQATRPVYEASSSVRIDGERSGIKLVQVLQALGSQGSPVQTEMEVMRSRSVAEDVVDSLRLQVEVKRPRKVLRSAVIASAEITRNARPGEYRFERLDDGRFAVEGRFRPVGEQGFFARLRRPRVEKIGEFAVGERVPLRGGALVLAPRARRFDDLHITVAGFDDAVRKLRKTIAVTRPNRDADVVIASYLGADPEVVRDVPNALMRRFIVRRQFDATSEAGTTVSYLRAELDSLGRQLATAEGEMRAFMEANQVFNLEAEATAQVRRLAEMQAQRDVQEAERNALARLLEDLRRAPAGEASAYRRMFGFPTLLKNAAVSDLLGSLVELETERAERLSRLTPSDPSVQAITQRIADLEAELRSIAMTYLQGLNNQVASANAMLAGFSGELARIPGKEITVARMTREAEVLGEIYALVQTRLKEAEIGASLDDTSVRVVDAAILPPRPVKPNKPLSMMLALVAGLALGVAGAVARESLDRSVHTRAQLRQLAGVDVLGLVPRMNDGAQARSRRRTGVASAPAELRPALLAALGAQGTHAEAYRAIRTGIAFASNGARPSRLLVTSPLTGDGKSATAANLASVLAEAGSSVLLLEADLRRPSLAAAFGTAPVPGLTDLLAGRATPAEVVRKGGDVPAGVHLIPAGSAAAAQVGMLASAAMRDALAELAASYDYVVLDSAAVAENGDALALAPLVDATLLVVRAGATDRDALGFTLQQLRLVDANVIGAVLNDVDLRRQPRFEAQPSRAPALHNAAV